MERPSFSVDSAHRMLTLIAVLLAVSLGSITVAPLLGALEGSIKPSGQQSAMLA
jgi:hypothetical protein